MKTLLQQEFFKRCRNVLQTQLNAGNKVKGLNMFAVPVIRYSAALLGWTLSEITNIERKFRKVLTMHGAHHLKSDVDRLYLPRRLGGRALFQLLMLLNVRKGLLQLIYTTLGTIFCSVPEMYCRFSLGAQKMSMSLRFAVTGFFNGRVRTCMESF